MNMGVMNRLSDAVVFALGWLAGSAQRLQKHTGVYPTRLVFDLFLDSGTTTNWKARCCHRSLPSAQARKAHRGKVNEIPPRRQRRLSRTSGGDITRSGDDSRHHAEASSKKSILCLLQG